MGELLDKIGGGHRIQPDKISLLYVNLSVINGCYALSITAAKKIDHRWHGFDFSYHCPERLAEISVVGRAVRAL